MDIFKISKIGSIILSVLLLPMSVSSQPGVLDKGVKQAVQQSDVAMLENWMANGGDINNKDEQGNSLLFLASKIGDKPTLKYLLSKKPKVNYQNKAGATALMIAAKYGHAHVIEMLLDKGADPTIKNNDGVTAAQFALVYDHTELFYKLQEAMLAYSDGHDGKIINS